MTWTALIPLKPADERKSRLAEALGPDERAALSDRMFDHVVGVLATTPGIADIVLLAPAAPEGWPHGWIGDEGRGLNAELASCREALPGDLLIVHADLPVLTSGDVEALLAAAEAAGSVIAPDRHNRGTNALALRDGVLLHPRFGANSFARHVEVMPSSAVVHREGLARDVDTPEDLVLAFPGEGRGPALKRNRAR